MSSRDERPRVGVVTVSYDSQDVLAEFLASVPAASDSPLHIVVADNKPEPGGEVQRVTEAHGAHWLPQPRNLGYGGAINAGVASLPAEVAWVLVSNPDVALTAGSIDTLIATGESDARIASVGPAVLNEDGTVYPSAREVPSLRTGVGHAMFTNFWPSNPWTRRYRNDVEGAVARRDAGWLSGSCVLVRRSAFDSIGGFDEGYFMYFEDVDLGFRFGKAGYRNVYEPNARVVHTGAHSTTGESARMIAAHHDSAHRFLAKKYAGWHLWPVRFTLGLGLDVRSALLRRRSRR